MPSLRTLMVLSLIPVLTNCTHITVRYQESIKDAEGNLGRYTRIESFERNTWLLCANYFLCVVDWAIGADRAFRAPIKANGVADLNTTFGKKRYQLLDDTTFERLSWDKQKTESFVRWQNRERQELKPTAEPPFLADGSLKRFIRTTGAWSMTPRIP